MAPKKKLSSKKIIDHYFDFVLENGEDPKSVYAFAKDYGFKEAQFYEHFSSFEALNAKVFSNFHEYVLELLEKNNASEGDAAHQLLSYYFTFFELLTANRSYAVFALKRHKLSLEGLRQLAPLRQQFKSFIESLEFDRASMGHDMLNSIQEKGIKEGAWVQFLFTMKFWLDDTSPGFEKTDLFIEKSVKASFDLLKISALESVIDFGKFFFKEKVMKEA